MSGPGPCDHRASSPHKPSCPSHPMKDRGSTHTQSQAPGGGWPSSGIQRKPGSSAPSQAPPSVRRAHGEEGRPGLGLWWLERREGPLSTLVLPCRSTGTSQQRPFITGSVGTTRCRAPGQRPAGRCVPTAGTGRAPGPPAAELPERVNYVITSHWQTPAPAPRVLEGWGPHARGLQARQQLWGQTLTPGGQSSETAELKAVNHQRGA